MHIKQYQHIINCTAILLCAFTPRSFAAGADDADRRPATYTPADFVPTPRPFPSLLELSVKATARKAVIEGKSLKDALKEGKVPDDLVDLITGNTVTDENHYLKIQALLIATPLIEAQMLGLLGKARHSLNVDVATTTAIKAWLKAVSTGKTIATNPTQTDLLGPLLVEGFRELKISIPAITLLLYAGADPNTTNRYGEPLLYSAVYASSPEAIRVLVNAGANPNTTNRHGETPLGIAVRNKYAECARALLAANADPNILVVSREDQDHVPLLLWTINYATTDLVRVLMDAGANPNITDSSGRTLLHVAAKSIYREEFIRALLDAGLNPNTEDSNGNTPLHAAVEYGNDTAIRTLLARSANPNIKNKKGETPLGLAVRLRKYEEVARALLAANANPNVMVVPREDQDHVPLLLWTIKYAPTDLVRALMDAGANLNITDSSGQTALHAAAKRVVTEEIIRALLDAGLNPNTKDSNDDTPLHAAAQHGNDTAIRTLLARNADPNIENKNGETPLGIAVRNNYAECARALLAANANPNVMVSRQNPFPLIFFAAFKDNETFVQILLAAGADPNTEHFVGETTLCYAAGHKREKLVRALLAGKANPSMANQFPYLTPLHYAAHSGCAEAIRALLVSGADPNKKDTYGRTPLHMAAQNGDIEIFGILLANGANPNITDGNGQTPVQVVLGYAHSTIVAMLHKESKRRAAQSRTMQISAIIRKLLPSCSRPPNTE